LPATVRLKHGHNRSGKTLHFYFNYSNEPHSMSYDYGVGAGLLTQSGVEPRQNVTLKPRDAAIVEEK
jgi:beta-galactosidase